MGLFEIQRQLAAESGASRARATRASQGATSLTDFLADAWHNVRDPAYVARSFAARARSDRGLALALARLDDGEPTALRALADEQRTLVAPLITSRLLTADAARAAGQLVTLGDPRSIPALQEFIATTRDEPLRQLAADAIATWGDVAEITKIAAPIKFTAVTATLARRGHTQAQAALVTALRTFLNEWHKRSAGDDWQDAFNLVDTIGQARIADAVPLLLACLATPAVDHALHALADLAATRAHGPARQLLRELGGTQPERQWTYRLAAERVLSVLGEPQPLTTAREVLAHAYPRQYAYPKFAEAIGLRAHALAALVDRGSDEDRELVARQLTSPHHELRAVAAAALTKLGRPVPTLQRFDEPKCKQILKHDGPAALVAALADPLAIDKDIVAKTLARTRDAAARGAALEWALAILEHTPNHPAEYLERDEVGIDAHTALEIVETLTKDRTLRPRITASTSAWILQQRTGEKPPRAAPPLLTGPWRASVRRLDRAPFVFGQQVNALALDPTGKQLAVVGDDLGHIVDAATGELRVSLAREYTWATDCAFSPDGEVLAVAYHGCHVVLFDAVTGQRLRTLNGPGGVPDATRRLAFSPDGKQLAVAGSDGSARLVDWRTGEQLWAASRAAGSFEAIAFTADDTCLFSHVKSGGRSKNFLLHLDLATHKSTRIEMPSSMWSLAHANGRWYAGGEHKKIRQLTADLGPARTGALDQAEVVRLAAAPDDTLLAVSQTGTLVRWHPGTGAKTPLLTDVGQLWALAVGPDGAVYAAGTAGTVHRFTAEDLPLATTAGEVHTDHVMAIVPLPDGTTLTAAWDGRLLRWPANFGTASLVLLTPRERLTCLAVDGPTAYAGADKLLHVIDIESGAQRTIPLGRARVEDVLIADATVFVALSTGHVKSFHTADLGPRAEVHVGDEATALARTAAGTLLVGTTGGQLVELDSDNETAWSRAEFARDLVDKDPHGNPHRTVVGLAVHAGKFAAAALDDSLRVFDHASHRRTLRLLTDVSLFNNCEFSPDGSLVAATGSHALSIFDATTGALALELHVTACPGADELTNFTFTAPHRLLVGAENGSLFEILLEVP